MFKIFGVSTPLFDQAPPDGGVGGGAGPNQPGAVAFDPETFKAELLTDIRKEINGWGKTLKHDLKTQFQLKVQDPPPDPPQDPQDPPPDPPQEPKGQHKPDPRVKLLEQQLKTIADKLTEAEQIRVKAEQKSRDAERDSKLREVLSPYQFFNPEAERTAFEIHRNQLKWTDEGHLVGPDDLPIEDYVKLSISQKQFLLASENVSGAGARKGITRSGRSPFVMSDIDNIKNMKPEDAAALRQHVSAVLSTAQKEQ